MYCCSCQAVTETQVEELVSSGVCDVSEIISRLALDDEGNCGACMRDPEWIFARVRAARRGPEGECAAPCGALALCARHDQTATTTRILEGLEPVKVGLVRGSESH